MLAGKSLYRAVFLDVRLVMILNVVIQGKHQLLRIRNLFRPNRFELAHHSRRVVMGQRVERPNREEVPCTQRTIRAFGHVRLRDFFYNCLRHRISGGWQLQLLRQNRLYASNGFRLFRRAVCFVVALGLADFAFRMSDSMSAIKSLMEPTRSRFQTVSFISFWAPVDSTPSASAENFSAIS